MFEVPEQANPTDPTEDPTDQPPEVVDPTDPTEGPTNQPPEVPDQADPIDPNDSPTRTRTSN